MASHHLVMEDPEPVVDTHSVTGEIDGISVLRTLFTRQAPSVLRESLLAYSVKEDLFYHFPAVQLKAPSPRNVSGFVRGLVDSGAIEGEGCNPVGIPAELEEIAHEMEGNNLLRKTSAGSQTQRTQSPQRLSPPPPQQTLFCSCGS